MKKRLLSILCVLAVMATVFTGCASKETTTTTTTATATETTAATTETTETTETATAEATTEYQTLRVMSSPDFNGVLLSYVVSQGWHDEIGLELDIERYANGSVGNEGLAAGLWDVGFQGAAYVFGVVNNDAKLIGTFSDVDGDMLFVREDSPILDVLGSNPTYPDIYGDAETVTGATILAAAGTSAHQAALSYLEALGVAVEDVQVVPLDYATSEQTFLMGEGDIVSLPTPWSTTVTAEHGWVRIAKLKDFSASTGSVICAADAYENLKPELTALMQLLYRAADELEADYDLKRATVRAYYDEVGLDATDETIAAECELRVFVTSDAQREMEYGVGEIGVAEFFTAIGNIEPEQCELFISNVVDDIWKAALED